MHDARDVTKQNVSYCITLSFAYDGAKVSSMYQTENRAKGEMTPC